MADPVIGGKAQKKKTNLQVSVACETKRGASTRTSELPAVRIDVRYKDGGSNVLLFPCRSDRRHALLVEKLLRRAAEATTKSTTKGSGRYCYPTTRTKGDLFYERRECVSYVLIDAGIAEQAGLDESSIGCFGILFETTITESGLEAPEGEGKTYRVAHYAIIDRKDVERLRDRVRAVRKECCKKKS